MQTETTTRQDDVRNHIFVGGAIVAVATVVRLWSPGLMEFRHDSAYWALEGLHIAGGGYTPFLGQQVGSVPVKLHNGPLLSYLTALIFQVAGPRPVVVGGVIAFLNAIGVFLTYRLGKRLYSSRTGLIAAALMATAPWIVLYGRMLWPQALFPFLIPMALLSLTNALEQRSLAWCIAHGFILGLGLQLHLSALALIGTSLLLIAYHLRGPWLVGACVAGNVLGYLPVLVEDARSGFFTLRALAQISQLHAAHDPFLFHSAKTVWNFANVLSGQALWVSKLGTTPYLPRGVDWTQGVVLSTLFLAAFVLVIRRRFSFAKPDALQRRWADDLVLGVVILPAIYLLLSSSSIQRHYFIFFYPAVFLILARGLDLWDASVANRNWPLILKRAPAVALAMSLTLNVATVCFMFRFLKLTGGSAGYGTIWAEKLRAVESILASSRGRYEVEVAAVQEPLPYVFLFEANDRAEVVRADDRQTTVRSRPASGEVQFYRIVEPTYYPLRLDADESLLGGVRAVTVVRRAPAVPRTLPEDPAANGLPSRGGPVQVRHLR